MNKLDLHIRLKQARKELNLNQIEIAKDLSIQQKTISEIENGKILNIPNTYIYYFYKKGVSLEWLYDNKGAMMQNENIIEKQSGSDPVQLDLLLEKLENDKVKKVEEKEVVEKRVMSNEQELLFERLIDSKDLTINSLLTFIKSQENNLDFLKSLVSKLNR
jgi:DNA-binding XRE family transcriptional regulator